MLFRILMSIVVIFMLVIFATQINDVIHEEQGFLLH